VLITADAGVQYFRGTDFLRGYSWAGSTASFSNANGFGGWLIVMIPLLLGIITTDKIRGKILKIILSILTVLLFICLVMTYSRGAWLGFAVGVFIIACYVAMRAVLKIKILPLLIGIYLLAIFLSLLQPMKTKIQSIGKISFKNNYTLEDELESITNIKLYDSNFIRIRIFKESIKIIKDYPLFGCGLNTYSKVAKKYKSFEHGGIYPHNSFSQRSAETGLPGLFAFLLVLFSFFVTSIKHIFLYLEKNNALVVGLLSGISAFLVHSFFDNHFYALQLVVLFWFMLGLTVAAIRLDTEDKKILTGT